MGRIRIAVVDWKTRNSHMPIIVMHSVA